ncbi:MAG: alpha/beta hydrolase family esterase [Chloroflexota bacterium]
MAIAVALILAGCQPDAVAPTPSPTPFRTSPSPSPTQRPTPTPPPLRSPFPGVVASAGCSAAEEPPTTLLVTVDGVPREAEIHQPSRLPAGPAPVVLAFHGYSGTSAEVEGRTGLSDKANSAGFIVVYPQGLGGDSSQWDLAGDTDVTFVRAVVAYLEAHLCVDTRRIYATGFSMGGGMANVLGCRMSKEIAAIAPVSALHGAKWEGKCSPTTPVPIVAFHGKLDDTLPYEGGEIVAFSGWAGRPQSPFRDWMGSWGTHNGCAANLRVLAPVAVGDVLRMDLPNCRAPVVLYTITDGGHTWPGGNNDAADGVTSTDVNATDAIWDFFAANPLPAAP